MMAPGDQRDWWAEARANKGIVQVRECWWDANGNTPEKERVIPEKLRGTRVDFLLGCGALMQTVPHRFAGYGDAKWRKLLAEFVTSVSEKKFLYEGRQVTGIVHLSLYKVLSIESEAEAEALDRVFAAWASFAHRCPLFAQNISLSFAAGKTIVVSCGRHLTHDPTLACEADLGLAELQAQVSAENSLCPWLSRYLKAGRRRRQFSMSQDIWFGPDSPAIREWRDSHAAKLDSI